MPRCIGLRSTSIVGAIPCARPARLFHLQAVSTAGGPTPQILPKVYHLIPAPFKLYQQNRLNQKCRGDPRGRPASHPQHPSSCTSKTGSIKNVGATLAVARQAIPSAFQAVPAKQARSSMVGVSLADTLRRQALSSMVGEPHPGDDEGLPCRYPNRRQPKTSPARNGSPWNWVGASPCGCPETPSDLASGLFLCFGIGFTFG